MVALIWVSEGRGLVCGTGVTVNALQHSQAVAQLKSQAPVAARPPTPQIIRPTAHHAALRSSQDIAVLHNTLSMAVSAPEAPPVVLQPSIHSAFTPPVAVLSAS